MAASKGRPARASLSARHRAAVDKVFDKVDEDHQNELRWTDRTARHFQREMERLPTEILQRLGRMSADELRSLAEWQEIDMSRDDVPEILEEITYYDDEGHFHNPLWYHG